MWPYWMLFLFPALFALQETRALQSRLPRRQPDAAANRSLLLAIPLLTAFIGWRYKVGGDWGNYSSKLDQAYYNSITDTLEGREPGFELLQWLAIQMDWGIYGVNLIAGALFSIGLIQFCRNLPRPWLALVIATPYMIIVVAMGYTRQGLALGLCMLGLVALGQQQVTRFALWILLASTFHNSAILLLPIAMLASARNRLVIAIVLLLGCALAYFAAFEDSLDHYADTYLSSSLVSEGALIRLTMNLLPAILILRWGKKFAMSGQQLRLWRWFSIISVALFAAYFMTSASTALDRIALYLLPLQLAVLSQLPNVDTFRIREGRRAVAATVLALVVYCAAVEFVWLNFANHAIFWLPYRFFPIEHL